MKIQKSIKDISAVKVLRSLIFSVIISIVVWAPTETLFLLREARLTSYIVEEDSMAFITRMKGELRNAENITGIIEDKRIFNMYRATIDDRIIVRELESESGAKKIVSEATFDFPNKPKRTAVQKAIIRGLSAFETPYYNQEPVTQEVRVRTFKKGNTHYYETSAIFNNGGKTYTVALERNLYQVYSRYMRLEIEALGQMLINIILTTVISGGFLMYFTAGRFKDTIVKQAQAVSLSYGSAPNLGRKQGSHLKEASDAVISLGKRLDEANERSVNALYDVSYYVSSHLAEIKQAIDLMKYYGYQNEEAMKAQMNRIEDNLITIKDINSTIANLTKVERSEMSINPQVYDIQDLLNLSIDLAKTRYSSFVIVNPKIGETKKISIQRDHFLLIIEALIQNAVKYTTGKEKKIVIGSMDGKVPEGVAQIYVKNWGIGVLKDEESRIFERYYRGSNTNQSKSGVGLGLHLVYKLVKFYDGDITVESEKKHDNTYETTFIVTFKEHKE